MASSPDQVKFIDQAALELGVTAEALRKWHERGKVPHHWRLPLLDQARAKRVNLDRDVFDNLRCIESAA